MSAHKPKPTITQARVDWFARYHAVHLAWGVFHVCLDDGNYRCGAADQIDDEPDDVREAAAWFNTLTQTQRKRLGRKADARMHELGLGRRPFVATRNTGGVVLRIDATEGRVTLGPRK